jgi:Domain of unknown function (DUF4388)
MKTRVQAEVEAPQLSGRFTPSFTPLVVLQACNLAELTGTLRARRGASFVSVSFAAGEVLSADTLESEGLDAIVALCAWTDGRFDFMGGVPVPGTDVPGPFPWLMLEVCRRLDETRAAASAGSVPPAS